jgi:GTP-binding protein|tara:strand:+ start:230 stop:946 length:717 start_codon:yes stop_codon:yes gene_type:complete
MMEKTDADHLAAAGRWLFARGCEFRLGVTHVEALPAPDRTEVAFAGRSNVGKSSLLNAITGQKALARTSNTPGRTQELNFFMLAPNLGSDGGNGAAWLVDLPGYGYARESKSKIAAWNKLLEQYLRGRPNLRRVFVLIDSRHGLKANDMSMMDDFDRTAVSYQVVLTKADKISQPALDAVIAKTQAALVKRVAAHPEIIATSSEKGLGLDAVRGAIAGLVELDALGYNRDKHIDGADF